MPAIIRNPTNPEAWLGFPLPRIAAVFSPGLWCRFSTFEYAGTRVKGKSELGMLRKLWDMFLSR